MLLEREEESRVDPGMIVDLSLGGVRLLTQDPLEVGKIVGLIIEIQEDSPLRLQGKVVWGRRIRDLKDLDPELREQYGVEDLEKYYVGFEFLHYLYGIVFADLTPELEARVSHYMTFVARMKH